MVMKLWMVVGSISSAQRTMDLSAYGLSDDAPRFDYVNFSEVAQRLREVLRFDMINHEMWDAAGVAFRAIPEPILRITDPDFRLDYFFVSQQFVSARLRSVIGLGPDAIVYRDVDTRQSSAAVQAQDYNMLYVVHRANPFDASRMPGRVRPVRQEDGSLRDEWIAETPERPNLSKAVEIFFREDFQPPAPIFRTIGWDFTLATDDFAERVMRAGIAEMAFLQIDGPPQTEELIFRQLP